MSLNLGSLGMEDASFNFGGSYIMALDCGTTSVLATIVDEYGCIVAQARRSVKTSFPRPGWVEQDPMAVLASQIAVMMEVQFKSGIHSDRIAAIGISNQRETTVVWDRVSGQPIYRMAVPPYRTSDRRACRAGRRRAGALPHGTHARPVFLGLQGAVDSR